MDSSNRGKFELQYANKNMLLQIVKLYPFTDDGKPVNLDLIKLKFAERSVPAKLNESLVNWYVKRVNDTNSVINNVTLVAGRSPFKQHSNIIRLTQSGYHVDDAVYWDFVYYLFSTVCDFDLYNPPPFKLLYAKRDEMIASQIPLHENMDGKTIIGETISGRTVAAVNFTAGDNVFFDADRRVYIAKASGYILVKDHKISVYDPFYITPDKMQLHFLNFERTPEVNLETKDISDYFIRSKISLNNILKNLDKNLPFGQHIHIANGRTPGIGKDAEIEYFFDLETKYAEVDETGQINYREVKKFPSVLQDDMLIRKLKPVKGDNGADLFGKVIQSNIPKDIIMKNGVNTRKEESETETIIYSTTEGLIEYKNGMVSIFGQLNIAEDIDFGTGNIDTKVNVHINGSVRMGFTVKSEKNVFIKGTIEDNCIIEAGGDLIINGGSTGEKNIINCGGNLSIRFINGGTVNVKGSIAVQGFILGSNVTCNNTITILGSGINMNEKGAIIDSEIFVKNNIYCPSVGNNKGAKTYIQFGCDKTRNKKIKDLEDALKKIQEALEELKNNFSIDITANNVYMKMKNMVEWEKDKIIKGLQERNKLLKQSEMLQKILTTELDLRKENYATSIIQISHNVFAPLTIECDNVKKMYDNDLPSSRFYYDVKERKIDRTRPFGA